MIPNLFPGEVQHKLVSSPDRMTLRNLYLGTLCVASCSQPTSFIKYAIFSIGDEV